MSSLNTSHFSRVHARHWLVTQNRRRSCYQISAFPPLGSLIKDSTERKSTRNFSAQGSNPYRFIYYLIVDGGTWLILLDSRSAIERKLKKSSLCFAIHCRKTIFEFNSTSAKTEKLISEFYFIFYCLNFFLYISYASIQFQSEDLDQSRGVWFFRHFQTVPPAWNVSTLNKSTLVRFETDFPGPTL